MIHSLPAAIALVDGVRYEGEISINEKSKWVEMDHQVAKLDIAR